MRPSSRNTRASFDPLAAGIAALVVMLAGLSAPLVAGAASLGLIPAIIEAQSSSSTICPANTCVRLPVTISRDNPTAVLGFSVTLQLSGDLALCAGTGSISEGKFLSSAGATIFQVIDNGSGSYTVDAAVLGADCGPQELTGTLFSVGVTSAAAGGTGSITVTSVAVRDCDNGTIAASPGQPGTVPIDNQAPTVTVTSPNGGESWLIGSSQSITWTATDNTGVANVDLAYSTDGGASFPHAIATAVANTGTFTWTVPNAPSAQARVQVVAHDVACSRAADASDASFAIRDPEIRASAGAGGSISPSGAVSVPFGTDQAFAIGADACFAIQDVLVDGASVGAVATYTFTNVSTDHTIAASFVSTPLATSITLSSSANPARFGTTVELAAHLSPAGATGTVTFYDDATPNGSSPVDGSGNAMLSIATLAVGSHPLTAHYGGTGCYAASVSPIVSQVITPDLAPTAHVIAPDGGDIATVGTELEIQWTATDDSHVASVTIRLSRDNGVTWELIAEDVPNSGSYSWTVTPPWANTSSTPVYSALIRVEAKDDANQIGSDDSDAPFAIFGNWLLSVGGAPHEFSLSAAWPNPSSGSLSMTLSLPKATSLRVSVVDLQGREVAVLASGTMPVGRYVLKWDGRTERGAAAAGLYFVRYRSPEFKLERRFILAR